MKNIAKKVLITVVVLMLLFTALVACGKPAESEKETVETEKTKGTEEKVD